MKIDIPQELKLIIGHKPPVYDVPLDWHIVTTDPNNKKDFFVEDNSIWTKNGDEDCLSEYSYLIPLAKKLKSMPEIKTIRLAQYRKILCNSKLLSYNYNQPHNFYCVDQKELRIHSINKITKSIQNEFLISGFYYINAQGIEDRNKTILYHYARAHHIEDLLKFLSDAVMCKVISGIDVIKILTSNVLLMAGIGIGVFPKDVFIKILEQAEKAAVYYYNNSWIKRTDNYQYRNLGFLLEILTGYLLIKELAMLNIDFLKVSGYLTIVDEKKEYRLGQKE